MEQMKWWVQSNENAENPNPEEQQPKNKNIQNSKKVLLTLDTEDKQVNTTVELSLTLRKLRESLVCMDKSYFFQLNDGLMIPYESETDFCVKDVLRQSKTLAIKKIPQQQQFVEDPILITIDTGEKKIKLKAQLSLTLRQLRENRNWIDKSYAFLYKNGKEIEFQYESSLFIKDIVYSKSNTLNIRKIVTQPQEPKISEKKANKPQKQTYVEKPQNQIFVEKPQNQIFVEKIVPQHQIYVEKIVPKPEEQQYVEETKVQITIDFVGVAKMIKVELLLTLEKLRENYTWIDTNHVFQFSDGSAIPVESERDIPIRDVINQQSKTLRIKQTEEYEKELKRKEDEEKQRLANEENQRKAKEEKDRKQKEEEQRKLQEEKKRQEEEQERKKKEQEEKDKKQKEEEQRKLQEEKKRQEEEQERKKKEQEEREAYQKLLRTPIKGSSKYGKEGILDILLYPRYKLEDLTDLERQNMKVVMVVGQTGSGKSTMLDAMVNYFSGVEFDYPFRYKLIDEKAILTKRNNDQSESVTDDVQQYFIKPGPNTQFSPILVVDTPGFMDTRGITRDEKITADIEKYFKNHLDQIHCVCLVSISSNVRLTCSQQYIFNRVLQIFGNDIEENIANLFTFCDGSEPKILSAIKKENIPSKYWYKFNNSALFSKKSNEGDSFERMYWEMNFESLKTFFKDVEKSFTAKSLKLTKEVLEERKRLEHTIVNIRPQIDMGLSKLEQVRKELQFLDHHSDQLAQNKDFHYTVEVEKFRKVPLDPGRNTTTCRECNRTCHKNCAFSDDDDKASCCAMTNEYCTVCPKKCHWRQHSNVPYIFEYYKEEEQRTSDDLKKKYVSAQSNLSKTDQILVGLSKELQDIKKEIYDNIQILQKSLQRLSQIALRPNPYSQTDIIDQMIQNESDDKKPGFQDRISSLEAVKNQYELLNKLTDQDRDKALQQFFQNHMSTFEDLKKKKQVKLCTIF